MALDLEQNPPPDNQSYCVICEPEDSEDRHRRKDRRNLVICIDGTSNQFGQRNTNVIELYSQLKRGDKQLTYYDSGIGTYARPSWRSWNYLKQVVDHKIDLAIAWNFEAIVVNAYKWLADNYQTEDRIFLFGFSRGAYQCRALAGMIHKVGLIHKGNERQIPFAYEIYADRKSKKPYPSRPQTQAARGWSSWRKACHTSSESQNSSQADDSESQNSSQAGDSESQNPAERFKDTFSRPVKVHFVGAWDTVSSIGVIRAKNLPDTVSPEHICFFRHALALDERRVKYLPEYAWWGTSDAGDSQQAENPSQSEGLLSGPRVKETWFAGTHSDIGGGNVLNPYLNRSNAPFLWMSYEAISAGLLMEPSNVKWKWKRIGKVNESLTGVWKLFEYLPFNRPSYRSPDDTTFRLHRGRGRKIQPGQKIHASVAFSPSKYRPKAILPKSGSHLEWKDLIRLKGDTQLKYPEAWKGWLEMDMFDLTAARTVISNLGSLSVDLRTSVHRLNVMTQSARGCDALRGVTDAAKRVFRVLQRDDIKDDMEHQVEILNALIKFATDIPGINNRESLAYIFPMLQDPQYREIVQRFITQFCQAEFKMLASLNLLSKLEKVLRHEARSIQKEVLQEIASWFSNSSRMLQSDTLKRLLAMIKEGKEKLLSLRVIIELVDYGDILSEDFESLVNTLQDNDPDARRLALVAIEKLLRRGDPCRKSLNSKLVEDASNMLKSHEGDTQRLALDIITVVARHEGGCGQIMKSNALTSLLEVFEDSSWISRCCALEAIMALAKYDDFRSNIVKMGVLARGLLQDRGSDVHQSSIAVVIALAEFDDFRSEMVKSNVLVRLVDLHQGQDSDIRQLSTKAITTLAKIDNFRSRMVETNFFARLFDLLKGDLGWCACQSSVKVITALAQFYDFRSKMLILDNLNRLFGLLQNPDWAVRQSSVEVITALAEFYDFRSKMLVLDNLNHLFGLLQNPDYVTRQSSVEVITALAKFDDFRSGMVEPDLSTHLFGLLQNPDYVARQSSVEVITALAEFDDFRSRMVESKVLTRLLELLQDQSLDVCQSSINAITALAKINDFRSEMVKSNVLVRLVDLLQDQNSDICQLSIKAITALAKINNFHSKMVETVLVRLSGQLQDRDSDVRQSSIEAITALAEFHDFRFGMVEPDFIDRLFDLLQNPDWCARRSSVEVITAMAKINDFHSRMMEPYFFTRLFELLQNPDRSGGSARQSFIEVITALTKISNFRSKMVKTEVPARHFDLLQDLGWDTSQSFVEVITALAEFNNFRSKMVETDVLSRLVGLLQKQIPDVCQPSIEAIIALANFEDFRSKMIKIDVVACLVGLLRKWNVLQRESSAKAIIALMKFDGFYSKMAKTSVLFNLVNSLQQFDLPVRESHFPVIDAMIKSDDFRIEMLDAQTIQQFVKMIEGGDDASQQFSINMIGRLAKYGCRPSSLEVDITRNLVNNFNHAEPGIQCSSIDCVTQYVKYDILDASRWPDVFKVLLPVFYNSRPNTGSRDDVQQACFRCICQSSEGANCRSALLEAGLLRVLMDMLEGNKYYDSRASELSLKVITELVKYDDFRERLCEYTFVTSIVGIIVHRQDPYCKELLDAVGELARYEETRSGLLRSRFISCLLVTLLECDADRLPEKHLPDISRSFITCVSNLRILEARYGSRKEMICEFQITSSMLDVFRIKFMDMDM